MTASGTGQYRHQTPDGRPVMTCLDWSGRDGVRHWGGGGLHSCRSCQQPTFLVDGAGRPQHKACAELEADRAAGQLPRQAVGAAEADALPADLDSPAASLAPEMELQW
jgi:hypothetical protein